MLREVFYFVNNFENFIYKFQLMKRLGIELIKFSLNKLGKTKNLLAEEFGEKRFMKPCLLRRVKLDLFLIINQLIKKSTPFKHFYPFKDKNKI